MPRDGSPTRTRLLDAAERLVIDRGFAATSVEQVIAASGSSKGAFFHHFATKADLAHALVERYVAADLEHLRRALASTADVADPGERLLAFLRVFEDEADELMSAQSSCLYVAALTEQQLITEGAGPAIDAAVVGWRDAVVELLSEARGDAAGMPDGSPADLAALADHVFVTFEGTFLLARATADPTHMRRQLGVLRLLVEAWLRR